MTMALLTLHEMTMALFHEVLRTIIFTWGAWFFFFFTQPAHPALLAVCACLVHEDKMYWILFPTVVMEWYAGYIIVSDGHFTLSTGQAKGALSLVAGKILRCVGNVTLHILRVTQDNFQNLLEMCATSCKRRHSFRNSYSLMFSNEVEWGCFLSSPLTGLGVASTSLQTSIPLGVLCPFPWIPRF